MFWNFHFNSSGLDPLLSKEDVTLKEILDEDDILQECKSQNDKLINFLTRDDILKELLHLVVDQPPEDVDEELKYKFKNLACEIITLDIYALLDKLACNQEYLDILWQFIDSPPPLNPLIASFFSKVISILMSRKGQETFEYLKSHDAVDKFLVHIDISAIMELFMKMVTVVETQELRTAVATWLDNENLIAKLINILQPSESEEKHYNVSQLLSELIRIGRESISQYVETEDPLLITLEKKETIESLLGTMFMDIHQANSDSSIISGITTLLSMMEIKRPVIEGMEEVITPSDLERIAQGIHSTLEVLSSKMQSFYEILTQSPSTERMETTFGVLDPPLGKVRLNIASLICTAVSTNTKITNDSVAQTGILSILMDLFSKYQWNNFLHTYVQNCVLAILNNETEMSDDGNEESTNPKLVDPLLKNLFQKCNIVDRCLKLWKDNEESEKTSSRKGYMGHLTKIVNEIVNAKEKGPNHEYIKCMFNEQTEEIRELWNELVCNSLAETNQRNLCASLHGVTNHFDSDSEGDDYKPISITQYDGNLQQAFENYQVQPMTNEFIESFGFDENEINEAGNIKNPFDDVGNIDFSINANEESENEKLFENICEQKIRPFNDSDDGEDDDDIWEEKQLEFSPPSQPRQSSNVIHSDSDSSDEEKSPADQLQDEVVLNEKEEEEMEVDNDQEKNYWTADFSNMDVQTNTGSTGWPGAETSTVTQSTKSSDEGFADFTDISKFEISGDPQSTASPDAMETDGSEKPRNTSVYEVMEEDNDQQSISSNIAEENSENKTAEENVSRVTQITVKSVKASSEVDTTNDLVLNTESKNENQSNNNNDSSVVTASDIADENSTSKYVKITNESEVSGKEVTISEKNIEEQQSDSAVVLNGPSNVNTEENNAMT